MPSFFIAAHVEHLDVDAELSSARACGGRTLPGKSTLAGSLIRSRASTTPSAIASRAAPGLLRAPPGIADGDGDLRLPGRLVARPCAWSCSGRTHRRAVRCRAPSRPPARHRARRTASSAKTVTSAADFGTLPIAAPPSLSDILRLEAPPPCRPRARPAGRP